MMSIRSSVDFTAWSSGLYIRIIPSPSANTQRSPRPDRVNMPAIAPNSLVLVTGASGAWLCSSRSCSHLTCRPPGFIAIHCVRLLLEGGYHVRATVRSKDKGEYIAELLGKRYPGKFEYVVVEDLEHEGAFDAAAHGVAGVLHTASPFHFDSEGRALDALINPAVNGTKNVLRSVLKADTVQRVVITSSFAAIGT
jgi:nucleoside-diphosphate-sugar epimerase